MLRNFSNKIKQQRGFTIIEVMIVLAIAGLIMVVVLVAVPQLQRNQRDSARQNVTARFSTELGNYSSNNNGAYPFALTGTSGTITDFTTRYITGKVELKNPKSGNDYAPSQSAAVGTVPSEDQLLVYPGGSCSGESVTGTISITSRQYAVRIALEGGATFYCVDNN